MKMTISILLIIILNSQFLIRIFYSCYPEVLSPPPWEMLETNGTPNVRHEARLIAYKIQ